MEPSRRSKIEINEAVKSVRELNVDLEQITKTLFKLPSLSDDFKTMRKQLYQGKGLCLVKGIPVDDYSDDDLALIHWGIGTHIGLGVSQSYRGDKIGKVMDMSHTGDTRRPYRSPGALIMHVDPVDVVALLCLRKAPSGGEPRGVCDRNLQYYSQGKAGADKPTSSGIPLLSLRNTMHTGESDK